MDWESGLYQPNRNKFEYDVYQPVYQAHLLSLSKWRQTNLACCAARQLALWTAVREMSGHDPSATDPADDFDEADYNRGPDDE